MNLYVCVYVCIYIGLHIHTIRTLTIRIFTIRYTFIKTPFGIIEKNIYTIEE